MLLDHKVGGTINIERSGKELEYWNELKIRQNMEQVPSPNAGMQSTEMERNYFFLFFLVSKNKNNLLLITEMKKMKGGVHSIECIWNVK